MAEIRRRLSIIEGSTAKYYGPLIEREEIESTDRLTDVVFIDQEKTFYDLGYRKIGAEAQVVDFPDFPDPKDYEEYSDFEEACAEWEQKIEEIVSGHDTIFSLPDTVGGDDVVLDMSQMVVEETNDSDEITSTKDALSGRVTTNVVSEETDASVQKLASNLPAVANFLAGKISLYDDSLYFDKDEWRFEMIPPEPRPEFYHDYRSFEAAYSNWVQVVSRLETPPMHPRQFQNIINLRNFYKPPPKEENRARKGQFFRDYLNWYDKFIHEILFQNVHDTDSRRWIEGAKLATSQLKDTRPVVGSELIEADSAFNGNQWVRISEWSRREISLEMENLLDITEWERESRRIFGTKEDCGDVDAVVEGHQPVPIVVNTLRGNSLNISSRRRPVSRKEIVRMLYNRNTSASDILSHLTKINLPRPDFWDTLFVRTLDSSTISKSAEVLRRALSMKFDSYIGLDTEPSTLFLYLKCLFIHHKERGATAVPGVIPPIDYSTFLFKRKRDSRFIVPLAKDIQRLYYLRKLSYFLGKSFEEKLSSVSWELEKRITGPLINDNQKIKTLLLLVGDKSFRKSFSFLFLIVEIFKIPSEKLYRSIISREMNFVGTLRRFLNSRLSHVQRGSFFLWETMIAEEKYVDFLTHDYTNDSKVLCSDLFNLSLDAGGGEGGTDSRSYSGESDSSIREDTSDSESGKYTSESGNVPKAADFTYSNSESEELTVLENDYFIDLLRARTEVVPRIDHSSIIGNLSFISVSSARFLKKVYKTLRVKEHLITLSSNLILSKEFYEELVGHLEEFYQRPSIMLSLGSSVLYEMVKTCEYLGIITVDTPPGRKKKHRKKSKKNSQFVRNVERFGEVHFSIEDVRTLLLFLEGAHPRNKVFISNVLLIVEILLRNPELLDYEYESPEFYDLLKKYCTCASSMLVNGSAWRLYSQLNLLYPDVTLYLVSGSTFLTFFNMVTSDNLITLINALESVIAILGQYERRQGTKISPQRRKSIKAVVGLLTKKKAVVMINMLIRKFVRDERGGNLDISPFPGKVIHYLIEFFELAREDKVVSRIVRYSREYEALFSSFYKFTEGGKKKK